MSDPAKAIAVSAASSAPLSPIDNPGMISPDEEALYFQLAKDTFDPGRMMVEIGPWLGRSTQRICQGIDSVSPDWTLYCLERFTWVAFQRDKAIRKGLELGCRVDLILDLKEGDSTKEAFLAYMGPFADRIDARVSELDDIATAFADLPAKRQPIATLFVDASKGWQANATMLTFFAPCFASSGRPSLIAFQDFLFSPAHALITLVMNLPQLRPIYYVEDGSTVAFEVAEPISPDDPLLAPKSFATLDARQILAGWERLAAAIPMERLNVNGVSIALPLTLLSRGFRTEARAVLEQLSLDEAQKAHLREKLTGKLIRHDMIREFIGLDRDG